MHAYLHGIMYNLRGLEIEETVTCKNSSTVVIGYEKLTLSDLTVG